MNKVPIREPFARSWVAIFPIERAHISIRGESKTIVASNNDTLRCAFLEPLRQRHVSVVTCNELCNYLRPRHAMGKVVSLRKQLQAFLQHLATPTYSDTSGIMGQQAKGEQHSFRPKSFFVISVLTELVAWPSSVRFARFSVAGSPEDGNP